MQTGDLEFIINKGLDWIRETCACKHSSSKINLNHTIAMMRHYRHIPTDEQFPLVILASATADACH